METLRNNHLSVFLSLSPLSLVRVERKTRHAVCKRERQEATTFAGNAKIEESSILLFYFSLLAAAAANDDVRSTAAAAAFLFFEFSLNIILYAFSYVFYVYASGCLNNSLDPQLLYPTKVVFLFLL